MTEQPNSGRPSLGYGEDLAYIHESGFPHFAHGAATLVTETCVGRSSNLVIDLGCGGGTLARLLVDAGFQVVGFDLSAAFLEIARQRVPEATFIQSSYLDADLPGPACAVTAIGEVFNYLFDERAQSPRLPSLFERVYRALTPEGLFLFDIAGPERAAKPSFFLQEDWAVLAEPTREKGYLNRKITSFRKTGEVYQRQEEIHQLLLIDPNEVAESLSQTHFSVERLDRYDMHVLPVGLHGFKARKL